MTFKAFNKNDSDRFSSVSALDQIVSMFNLDVGSLNSKTLLLKTVRKSGCSEVGGIFLKILPMAVASVVGLFETLLIIAVADSGSFGRFNQASAAETRAKGIKKNHIPP